MTYKGPSIIPHSAYFRKKEDQVSGAIWDTLPVTEKEKDEICFQNLPSSVKINQFPGLFSIGRKDSLWRGYRKMRDVWGSAEFDFHSRTFILPEDRKEVEEAMEKENKAFIMKPPNWYCGIGIKLLHRLGETLQIRLLMRKNIPTDEIPSKERDCKVIIQEYISNPLLIDNLKFDVRVYVLMTSIEPLKLYVYEDGLVRDSEHRYKRE